LGQAHLKRRRFTALAGLVAVGCAFLSSLTVRAQLSVRPEDPSGVAIREQRVRVIHADSPALPGTSMYLQQADPWLAYQRGRSYYFHEWGNEDGAFRWLQEISQAAPTTSCGMCHNLPFPSPGSGGNIVVASGIGRNTPHMFGAGLLETIGIQVRAQTLAAFDTNHNGYIDYPAETRGKRLVVEAAPGAQVDYGSLDDLDGNGRPDLNRVILVMMVDKQGRRVLFDDRGRSPKLGDPGIAGYDLAVGAFAGSSGDHQFASLRFFAIGVLNQMFGILPDVPTVEVKEHAGGLIESWGKWSNAGAFETDLFLTGVPQASPDPTRSGTISEGELDLFEWFLMNHPAPGHGPQNEQTRRGRALMESLGCTSCHVSRWVIQPGDERSGMPGDRRVFNLDASYNPQVARLEGRLQPLTRKVVAADGTVLHVPRRERFVIEDVFTDLRHHDLGPQFWEYTWSKDRLWATKAFKTTALWGVGSTAPYGHDGMSPTLDSVIRRHGGEAEAAQKAYVEAPEQDRAALVAFLESLVLYRPETLPTDINGDGRIDPSYKIGGLEVGPERFQPELMFKVPPHYRGWTVGPDGDRFFSYELLNVADAYGEKLPALVSSHGDRIPDLARTAGGVSTPHPASGNGKKP
jgi:hypothetical protein